MVPEAEVHSVIMMRLVRFTCVFGIEVLLRRRIAASTLVLSVVHVMGRIRNQPSPEDDIDSVSVLPSLLYTRGLPECLMMS